MNTNIRDRKVAVATTMKTSQGATVEVQKDFTFAELTSLPLSKYLSMKGRFMNTESARYYDSALYRDAPITPADTAKLFSLGIGRQQTLVNDKATTITKKENVTNMTGDGQFDNGEDFILEGIEVDVTFTANPMTFVGGDITSPTAAAIPNYSATNHLLAVLRQFKLTFTRGAKNQPLFSGLLEEFPPSALMSGAFGGADGFVQNIGRGSWQKLSSAELLGSEEKFHVNIEPLATSFTPLVPFNIRVSLVGVYVGTLYA